MAEVNFVFLHGGGQGGWVWDETVAALRAQAGDAVRCLVLDGPGCGTKRGRDTGAMDFAAVNAELVGDVVASGLGDCVLVGHSQAGIHIPAMIAARPDLFARVVYVSCSAPDPGLTVAEMTGQRLHGGGGHPFLDSTLPRKDRYKRMFCNDMAEDEAEAFAARLDRDGWPACCYAEKDWRYDHLGAVPASYVVCLQDAILPPVWQERFAERFQAGRVARIDAGHQAMNSRPQALAEILLAEARA